MPSIRTLALTALCALALTDAVAAQERAKAAKPTTSGGVTNRSAAAKIASAASSAPRSLSEHATIMDWPASDSAPPTTLREGTNGWSCFPDNPASPGNDAMCVDDQWMAWMDAYMKKAEPKIQRVGVGYMIAPGGMYGSNVDPFAKARTATNDWGYDPPHIMIIVPDLRALEGMPTSRESGGSWVMWTGTPYAHIMIPTTSVRKK